MRTMAEDPLIPSYSDPVTTMRWAVVRYGTTLDGVRLINIMAEQQDTYFYAVQGPKGPELRSIRKGKVSGRYETKEDAEIAVSRAKLAWDAKSEPVAEARKTLRTAEQDRDAAWHASLKERTHA